MGVGSGGQCPPGFSYMVFFGLFFKSFLLFFGLFSIVLFFGIFFTSFSVAHPHLEIFLPTPLAATIYKIYISTNQFNFTTCTILLSSQKRIYDEIEVNKEQLQSEHKVVDYDMLERFLMSSNVSKPLFIRLSRRCFQCT